MAHNLHFSYEPTAGPFPRSAGLIPPPMAQATHILQQGQYAHPATTRTQSHPVPHTLHTPQQSTLVHRLMSAIEPMLAGHQQATMTRMDQLENSIRSLSSEVTSVRGEAQAQITQVAQYLDKAYAVQQTAAQELTERFEGLQNVIGLSYDRDETKTLMSRLDTIEFAVEDLLERAKDPDAALPDAARHEFGTSLEQQPQQRKIECRDTGVNPRTPEPSPPPPPVLVSTGVGTIPDDDFFASSRGSRRDSSSDAMTVVGDRMDEDENSDTGDILNFSHKELGFHLTMNKELTSTPRREIRVRTSAPIQAHFSTIPSAVSDSPLVPVDWSKKGYSPLTRSNYRPKEPVEFFRPKTSLAETEPYMLLHTTRSASPDGTIASLRFSALGDSLAGPTSPAPPHPTSQFFSCPSVSPMPSPPRSISPNTCFAPPASPTPGPATNSRPSPELPEVCDTMDDALSDDLPITRYLPTTHDNAADLRPSLSPDPVEEALAPPASSPYADSLAKDELSVSQMIVPPTALLAGSLSPLSSAPVSLPPSPKMSHTTQTVPLHPMLRNIPVSQASASTPSSPAPPSFSVPSPIFIDDESEPSDVQTETKLRPKPPAKAPDKKKLNLKTAQAAGQSSAATRIKKRKQASTSSSEPPLKRVRRRSRREVSVTGSMSTPEWPEKSVGDDIFVRKFVHCDGCSFWYHYGCVGIVPGDVRLLPTEIFMCPSCRASAEHPRHQSTRGRDHVCARPDCSQDSTPGEFFVSGIIGRMTKVEGGRGRRYVWLVKWDGYPISQATWEGEDSMADPEKLLEEFNDAVQQEGLEVDDHSKILLREAVEGGWDDSDNEFTG